MQIFRPASGFVIVLHQRAQAAFDAALPAFPRLPEVWEGICERLKFTAHREGEPLADGTLAMQFPGSLAFGVPKIAVIYTVKGDCVTVRRLLVVA